MKVQFEVLCLESFYIFCHNDSLLMDGLIIDSCK